MSKQYFTPEQVRAFRRSPYVQSVSEKSISFTPGFKFLAYAELQTGKPMSQIFMDNGIDSGALGAIRVLSFQQALTEAVKHKGGFHSLRKPNAEQDAQEDLRKTIEQLEQQIAHNQQLVEHLKKMRSASENDVTEYSRVGSCAPEQKE